MLLSWVGCVWEFDGCCLVVSWVFGCITVFLVFFVGVLLIAGVMTNDLTVRSVRIGSAAIFRKTTGHAGVSTPGVCRSA